MKLVRAFFIIFAVAIILSLMFIDKKINIAVTNSTNIDSIKVSLRVDNSNPIKTRIGISMVPVNDFDFDGKFGFQNIYVRCDDLGLEKQIRIFTIYKNNVHIEFTTDLNDKYVILTINSWFGLWYD